MTRHVIEIHMWGHYSNISFLWILSSCPKLTRFVFNAPSRHAYTAQGGFLYNMEPPFALIGYEYNPHDDHKEEEISPQLIHSRVILYDTSPMLNITELDIGNTPLGPSRLTSILQRCPNVKSLVFSLKITYESMNFFTFGYAGEEMTRRFDLRLLFTWCPKLQYMRISNPLQGYTNYILKAHIVESLLKNTGKSLVSTTTKESNEEREDLLEYLLVRMTRAMGPGETAPLLSHWGSSIKHFILSDRTFYNTSRTPAMNQDWTSVFRSFYAPHLHSLILVGICYDEIDAVLGIIHACRHSLETLVLYNSSQFGYRTKYSLQLSRLLFPLERIKHLELNNFELNYSTSINTSNNDKDDPIPLFKRLAALESTLEAIKFDKNITNITQSFLLATTYLPTLKRLWLTLDDNCDTSYDNPGLCLFAERLHHTRIELLELHHLHILPRSFLLSIATLPTLKEIAIKPTANHCRYQPYYGGLTMHGPAYFQMIRQSTSLQRISIFPQNLSIVNDDKEEVDPSNVKICQLENALKQEKQLLLDCKFEVFYCPWTNLKRKK
ncbi:hypothetical protein BDA99DRAFT_1777 [Phascolomyces articulosus]|uniref:Uncharacterized protein n=1 Tax=Phascolomyces articulosus TaxID=60185 RepID=A0AAD5KBI3_9FUNG|nr:hypothetical protein BDA99DRAFT_1777 [Phascolomyces articulosus]